MLNKRLWWARAFSQWIHVAWKVFVSQHVTPLRYNLFFLMVKSFTALVFIDLKRMECDNHCVAQFQIKDVLRWHREEVLGRWVVHYINLCSRSIGEHPGSRLGETPTEDWTVHRYDAINTFTPAVMVNNNSCIPCGIFSTFHQVIHFLFYLFFTVVLPLQKNKSVLHLCRVFS